MCGSDRAGPKQVSDGRLHAEADAGQVLACLAMVAQPGADGALVQRATVVSISGTQERHPSIIDERRRREGHAAAGWGQGRFVLIGVRDAQGDVV